MTDRTKIIKAAKETYDRAASDYDMVTGPFQTRVVYPKLIELLKQELAIEGKRVLDAGCGSGRLIELLKQRGALCQGIDASTTFVKKARTRGLDVIGGSIDNMLQFEDGSFDAVVSNYVINHLPQEAQAEAFKEQSRVLEEDGVFVFTCMHPRLIDHNEGNRVLTVTPIGEEFTLFLNDQEELGDMLNKAGFTDVRFEDPEIPPDLQEIIERTPDETTRQMMRGFDEVPYALFVIAHR